MRRLSPALVLLTLAACAQEPAFRSVQIAGPTEAAFSASRRPAPQMQTSRGCRMPALDNPMLAVRMLDAGVDAPYRPQEVVIFDCAPRRTAWR